MEAIRVSFVGDCATGKTSTIVAISSGGSFPHDGIEQAQVDQANSAILKRKGKSVTVNLVDTSGSGEDDGDRNRVSKYQDSDILCVLFSIISPFSYDNVTAKWLPEIARYAPGKPIILVGTKADLRDDVDALDRLSKRQLAPITFDQGNRLRRAINATAYLEVSAQDPESYSELLSSIASTVLPTSSSVKSDPLSKKRRSSTSGTSKDIKSPVASRLENDERRRKSCTVL